MANAQCQNRVEDDWDQDLDRGLAAGLAKRCWGNSDVDDAPPRRDRDPEPPPRMGINQATATLLITHGSPDPRAQAAAHQLTQWVQQAIGDGGHPLIGLASLEQAELPLYEQICQFGAAATQAGYNRLQLFPLFLLPGVHVMEDIPAALRQAQRMLGKDVIIELRAYLGAYSGLVNLLQTRLAAVTGIPRILLAHGSRLASAQQQVAAIAQAIQAQPAYLTATSTAAYPDLATCLHALAATTVGPVVILPYALFEGKMTAAIAHQVAALAPTFPRLQLQVESALGTDLDLATLIATVVLAPPDREIQP